MPPELAFSRAVSKALKDPEILGKLFAFRIESSCTCPGIPDWCVIFPGGQTLMVELKAGSRLTPAQVVIHRQLLALDIPTIVLTKLKTGFTMSILGSDNKLLQIRKFSTLVNWIEFIYKEYTYDS